MVSLKCMFRTKPHGSLLKSLVSLRHKAREILVSVLIVELPDDMASLTKSIADSLLRRRTEYPVVTLDLPQLDRYHDQVEKALSQTIVAYGKLDRDVDVTQWCPFRSRLGIGLFLGRQVDRVDQTPLLCVGTLRGRLDDVLGGLYCDNTEEMLLMNAIKCPRLTESAVLYTAQKQTPHEPFTFTGIKCATIKLPLASNRDLCYFDKMGTVRQASGKRMVYHVMQSVDLAEYPHKKMHKRVRVSLCFLFEELEDDLVGVYMRGEMEQTALSYFATIAMSDLLLAQLANALECTRAKKLGLMMSNTSQHNPSRKKSCYVCNGKRSFFESMFNCAGCNEYVCKKCRFREIVLVRATGPRGHLKRAEFCSVCISKMTLSTLDRLRLETNGGNATERFNVTRIEEEEEVEEVETVDSHQLLATFVHRVSIQMHELNTDVDNRTSTLSSMGNTSMFEESVWVLGNESDEEDVLNSSRLKSNQFVASDKTPFEMSRRSSSILTSTSSFDHDVNDTRSIPVR